MEIINDLFVYIEEQIGQHERISPLLITRLEQAIGVISAHNTAMGPQEWITTIPKKRKAKSLYVAPATSEHHERRHTGVIERPIIVKGAVSLPAHVIQSLDEVVLNGVLYYIPWADHFAIKVAGHVLHGNIGNIDKWARTRTKNCIYGANCKIRNCTFYHNPFDTHRAETRNFTPIGLLEQVSAELVPAQILLCDKVIVQDKMMHYLLIWLMIMGNNDK
jgi:hypothetical protein